jgi:hypothetical protein
MRKIKKRRLEITTETYQKMTFRRKTVYEAFCEICNSRVLLFSKTFVIQKLDLKFDETEQMFTNKSIHFVGATKMICGNFLRILEKK